jgi:hypothetical protein
MKRETMKHQQTILKKKRGKSEIKMEKLLFAHVAEGNLVIKYCLIYLSSISN